MGQSPQKSIFRSLEKAAFWNRLDLQKSLVKQAQNTHLTPCFKNKYFEINPLYSVKYNAFSRHSIRRQLAFSQAG